MKQEPNGELIPLGGGDSIPLVREVLSIGRRESCDIHLPFPNISGIHCRLQFKEGRWLIEDLKSTNGVKVNGQKVAKKLLSPGDTIGIAKRKFVIQFEGSSNQVFDEFFEDKEDIAEVSLLEKAGLVHRPRHSSSPPSRSPVAPPSADDDDDD